jgi:nucleotide-binding universal stress UspA family protein
MFTINRILHPTDFSDAARGAFHLACSLARDHGSRLMLLYVAAAPTVPHPPGLMQKFQARLDKIVPTSESIQVERRIVEGDPAAVILRVAEETNCDLIVMGTHGRSGLSHLLMGSVAEVVVRKSTCPVLVAKVSPSRMKEETEMEDVYFD